MALLTALVSFSHVLASFRNGQLVEPASTPRAYVSLIPCAHLLIVLLVAGAIPIASA
jgi:hypothetical protein